MSIEPGSSVVTVHKLPRDPADATVGERILMLVLDVVNVHAVQRHLGLLDELAPRGVLDRLSVFQPTLRVRPPERQGRVRSEQSQNGKMKQRKGSQTTSAMDQWTTRAKTGCSNHVLSRRSITTMMPEEPVENTST